MMRARGTRPSSERDSASFWTPTGVARAVGGRWLAPPADAHAPLAGLSIDSRTLKAGEVFLALKGETHDGHDHIAAAMTAGAALVVCSDPSKAPGDSRAPILLVENSLAALERAAVRWRSLLAARVVAVTGSSGKTTTARIIHAALSRRLRSTVSAKSLNNHIGVPLTILRARAADECLIAEVGMNSPGEIAARAATLRPDLAAITNVGRAHVAHVGGPDGVRREKLALLRALPAGGLAVVPAALCLDDAAAHVPAVITFGAEPGAHWRVTLAEHVSVTDDSGRPALRLRVGLNNAPPFLTPLLGAHNALNIAAAAAVVEQFGFDPRSLLPDALSTFEAPDMRLQRTRVADIDLFNDAYNANPESMSAAIRAFADLPLPGAARRVVVLGDKLELGEHSAQAHREIGALLAREDRIDMVVAVGPAARAIADECRAGPSASTAARPVHSFDSTSDSSIAAAAALVHPGDAVLLKASRSVRLERLLDHLASRTLDPTAASSSTCSPYPP